MGKGSRLKQARKAEGGASRAAGQAVRHVDFRSGRAVTQQADEALARKAGQVLTSFMKHGPWTLRVHVSHDRVATFDVRTYVMRDLLLKGLKTIPGLFGKTEDGKTTVKPIVDLMPTKIGQELLAWMNHPEKALLRERVPLGEGQFRDVVLDLRPMLNQLLKPHEDGIDKRIVPATRIPPGQRPG